MTSLSTMTAAEAGRRIVAAAQEGRLVQGYWRRTAEDGRQLACLLAAISPDIHELSDCPTDLIPRWLAKVTMVLFDQLPAQRLAAQGERYGRLLAAGRMRAVEPGAHDHWLAEALWGAAEAARLAASALSCWELETALPTLTAVRAAWAAARSTWAAARAEQEAQKTAADRLFSALLDELE